MKIKILIDPKMKSCILCPNLDLKKESTGSFTSKCVNEKDKQKAAGGNVCLIKCKIRCKVGSANIKEQCNRPGDAKIERTVQFCQVV